MYSLGVNREPTEKRAVIHQCMDPVLVTSGIRRHHALYQTNGLWINHMCWKK